MPVLISGILRDGAGKPVQGCTIHLKAKRTSPTVVVEIISSDITGHDGSYRIEAEPGYYSVSLLREGFPPSVAGEIYVTPTDAPDTLNAFLDAPKDADLRPEVMKRFEEMVNRVVDLSGATEKDRERAEQAAQSAGQSRDSAALSATAAAESQAQAERSAAAADVSARSADDSEQAASTHADNAATSEQKAAISAGESAQSAEESAESARLAGQHKEDAALSAQAAKSSEDEAAKSAKEAAGTLADALKKENNLSEFSGASDEVLNQLYANLKLGAAAKSGVQRNIYDRVEGRLPVQNSFGFGRVFTSEENVRITAENTFDYWIKYAYPGRYLISESGIKTIDGVVFSGVVDVIWIGINTPTRPEYNVKMIYFFGVSGNLYMNRYWVTSSGGLLIGWENLKQEVLPFGAVRTYALMSWNKNVEFQSGGFYPGTSVSGANLVWANIPGPGETQELSTYPAGPAGTWRVLGRLGSATQTALFYRIL